MKKDGIRTSPVKIAISASAVLIPAVIFTANQFILQVFKPANQSISVKIGFALQPSIYLLFLLSALIQTIIILKFLKPLFAYINSAENYSRARKASLRVPWLLILTNTGLWLAAITLFYGMQGFKTGGGVPYFWSLSTNSISGCMSAVTAALVINRILIPVKIKLNMTEMQDGESDVFVRIKMILIMATCFIYTILILVYASRYFAVSYETGIPVITKNYSGALAGLSLLGFIPLCINTALALTEDRIQKKQLLRKMEDLSKGSGDLTKKVTLFNFDDTGRIASEINNFIEKIRHLVIKVDQTGRQVSETSILTGKILHDLFDATKKLLDSISRIDIEMSNQEKEIGQTRSVLNNFFSSLSIISGNIDEQAASVEQTSSAIEEMAASIKAENEAAREVEKLTSNLTEITSSGSEHISNLIGSIRRVEDSSIHVEEILEHLHLLSEQIDILAINAAIEAAHAGDSGKGFAVVADEIRRLSENSTEKSTGISNLIKEMLEAIEYGNDMTMQADSSFSDIKNTVELTFTHFHNIYRAIEEETAGIEEMLQTSVRLVSITEDLKNLSSEQTSNTGIMRNSIESVFNGFSVIKSSVMDQKENRESITEALEQMNRITAANIKKVDELNSLLKEFSLYEKD